VSRFTSRTSTVAQHASITLGIDVRGIAAATAAATTITEPRVLSFLQEAINREGKSEAGRSAREIRDALPVKLKYIRARIKWRNADKTGQVGRLRFLGLGRMKGSGFIRPRHMRPEYSVTAPARTDRGQFARSGGLTSAGKIRSGRGVTFGVGGLMAGSQRQSVPRSFVASIEAGPTFIPPWARGFKAPKSHVFQRAGRTPLPITKVEGVTVGAVASRIGQPDRAAARLTERARAAFIGRLEREMKTRAAKT